MKRSTVIKSTRIKKVKNNAQKILTLNFQLVLKLNFAFNGEHYIQTRGVAMGTRMGPSYACLFVGHIEDQMLT